MLRLSHVLVPLAVSGLLMLPAQRIAAADAGSASHPIAPPAYAPWQPAASLLSGNHYQPIYGPRGDRFIDVEWINSQRGWALVATACGDTPERCPAVYGTQNGGRTWRHLVSLRSFGCNGTTACVDAVRFVTPRIGYLYGPAFFMTTDGGRVWTRVLGPPVESLVFSRPEIFRLTAQGSGCPGPCRPSLQRSPPGGRLWVTAPHWRDASEGFGEQLLASGRNLYTVFYGHIAGGAGSAHATIELSHDGGHTWVVRRDPCGYTGPAEEDTSAAAASGSSLGILCVSRGGQGPNFVAFSHNAGRTFTASAPLRMRAPEQIAIDAGSDIAVGNGGITGSGRFDYELALSRNSGRTWHVAIHDHEQVAEDPAGGSLQLVGSQNLSWVGYPYRLWQSFNEGQTWRKLPAP